MHIMATKTPAPKYIPGVCNIGQAEIAQRNRAGLVGLISTVILWAGLVYLQAPHWLRFVVSIPAAIGAVGYIQASLHFCADFGIKGVFNLDKEAGKTDTIQQAEFRAQDRAKAFKIFLASLAVGLAVGFVAATA